MSLSVLTIVKDRPAHLAQLIEGLRRSADLPDELIIVDMASDPPVSAVETGFPIRIIRLENSGLPLARARNVAAEAATGESLLFLDVDCIPMRRLTAAARDNIKMHDALLCWEALYLGPQDARSFWTEAELLMCAKRHPARQFPSTGLRREENAGLFWSLIFGISKARFISLGGFNEAFTGYGAEDTDFGFRARDNGVPLLFLAGPGAFHQHHDTYDPPLQHLADIVRNARLFHTLWGVWPMEGWLKEFTRSGFIAWNGTEMTILKLPQAGDIRSALIR